MADLSQYASDMAYLKQKADNRTLDSGNSIYKKLKAKAKQLPELGRWLAREIDPYLSY